MYTVVGFELVLSQSKGSALTTEPQRRFITFCMPNDLLLNGSFPASFSQYLYFLQTITSD